MGKTSSFIKLIRFWGIIFPIGIGISIVTIDVISSYHYFNSHTAQMRTEYTNRQKQIIKQEVNRVVDLIFYEKAQGEILTKEKIKSRVYEAYSIAQNIYQLNHTTKNDTEIQQMIIDALRPIRFEQESGYYFITSTDGVEILFANKPEMEGLNLLNFQDTLGQYVVKDMIEIVEQSGEGFYEYQWTKPDAEGKDFQKISFIKRFEPYDWFIGTGLYVVDFEDKIKADLLSTISRIRFGKEGYIFINRLNGDALVSNGKLFSGTKKLWEVFNENPEKMKDIFAKEHSAALKPEGDYIYYSHIKLTNPNKESPKTSFIYGIPDLQWLVGAGVYLDDVETDIALMRTELINQTKLKTFYSILIVMGISTIIILFFNWLNRRLKNDLKFFLSFFNRAAYSHEKIDRENIKFVELDQMAGNANKMLADRKQAEEELLESEGKYKSLANNLNVGIFRNTVGSEGKFLEANPAIVKMFGFDSRAEFLKISVIDLYKNSNDRKKYNEKLLKEGTVKNEELKLRKKDGTSFIGSVSAVVVKNEENKVKYYDGIIEDITARKRTEAKLRKSEERYREYFEENIAGSYISSTEGHLIACNKEYERIFGFNSTQDALETPIEKFSVNPNQRVEFLELLKKEKRVTGYKPILKKIDGTPIHLIENASGVFNDNGDLKHIRGFLLDVTEQRKLEFQLQQSQKMESIGTLAGGIAHDFNNILFPVIGHTEIILMDTPEDSPIRDSLNQIYTSALRARDLVKQILTFSRQKSSELMLMKMQPVVKEALKLIRSTIPTTIKIKQDIHPDCGVIKADPTQIHQIVMNLATNAYHAMEEKGGELKVSLKQMEFKTLDLINLNMEPGFYACLIVSDTGLGMDKNLIAKVFDPFFTTKPIGKGTGMGLSVVHGIVTAMGGAIHVYSELEKGAEFHVYLPIEKNSFEEQNIQSKTLLQGGSERILIVDDEAAIITMEKQMLEHLGYQVTSRTSSLEALEAFSANPDKFDLIITDMAMPNMPGDKLSVALIKIRPDIPILLCTGFSETMSKEKTASLGINGFILKPIMVQDLAQKIREVLDEN
jgi:PAS domain S-box-containing protein